MQTKKYNNGQRSPPPMPKTGSNLQGTLKAVLGCQKTNGINPRSAIRPQQHNFQQQLRFILHLLISTFNRHTSFTYDQMFIVW